MNKNQNFTIVILLHKFIIFHSKERVCEKLCHLLCTTYACYSSNSQQSGYYSKLECENATRLLYS